MVLTAEQRLTRSHITLMRSPNYALMSGIILMGVSAIKDDVPTAYTNGRDKYYGRAFVDKQSDQELCGLVLHENFHVMYKHTTTWRHLWEKDPKLANMACDYVINQHIVDMDPSGAIAKLPKGALLDPKYRGWDAGRVFADLQANPPQGKGKGGEQGSLDEHDWEAAKNLSEEEQADLERAIDQAVRQGDILAAKLGGTGAREIGALPEPKVDWRVQLRDFVTTVSAGRDSSTWSRPNRRWLAQDMYMPSPYSESVGPVVIGIDTSGSISPRDIAGFLAEIGSITQHVPPERIHLLYWDTKIAREETYMPGEYASLAQSTKPAGGGGTDPTCVKEFVQRMHTKPEFVLMLSDGYIFGEWPNFNVPTMWAMTSDVTARNATTIRI